MKRFRGIGVALCALLSVLTMSGNVALQPTDVYLTGGQRQHITYDGLGGKLSVEYSQVPEAMLTSPETVYPDSEYKLQSRRSYVGPHVFRDGKLEYSAFAGGYFDPQGGTMYYLTDWQGNNAVVADNKGNVVQETTYYPYGEPTVEPTGQRYLFGGKEREHAGGRNAYDFGARILTPYGSWSTPDPLVWKFYPLSPYSYCGGDPINNIDPDGKQIFVLPSPLLGSSNPLLLSSSDSMIPKPISETVAKASNTIEKHHVIPRALRKEPIVDRAIKKGFKFNGKDNNVPIEKYSRVTKTGRHGNHPKYTDRITKRLDKINKELEDKAKINPKDTPKIEFEKFENFVEELKQIINDNPNTKINDLEFQQGPILIDWENCSFKDIYKNKGYKNSLHKEQK